MNPETLQALQESIAHWERLASGKRKRGESLGIDDCPLCQMFNRRDQREKGLMFDTRCEGCPVKEHTKQRFCEGTPFEQAEDIAGMVDEFDEPLNTEMFKEAAERELEFLKSLLPE